MRLNLLSATALTALMAFNLLACSSQPTKSDSSPAARATAPTSSVPKLSSSSDEPPIADTSADSESTADELKAEREVVCKKGNEERWLDIEAFGENGCKLWYTKSTLRKAVAWSSHAKNHCNTAREKMIDNLEGDGFECK